MKQKTKKKSNPRPKPKPKLTPEQQAIDSLQQYVAELEKKLADMTDAMMKQGQSCRVDAPRKIETGDLVRLSNGYDEDVSLDIVYKVEAIQEGVASLKFIGNLGVNQYVACEFLEPVAYEAVAIDAPDKQTKGTDQQPSSTMGSDSRPEFLRSLILLLKDLLLEGVDACVAQKK